MGRLRKKPWADDYLLNSNYVESKPENNKGLWNKEIFNNDKDLYLEIGIGKGKFTIEHAENNPNNNYVGVEKFPSVLVVPVKVTEEKEITNLKFVSGDATDLIDWFEDNSVSHIYLNFSDPWPKERHAKRRLVYRNFLNIYHQILKEGGELEFKTDQLPLFEFALEEIKEHTKFEIVETSWDLHSEKENVIMTEYETRFTKMGNKIYFVKIKK